MNKNLIYIEDYDIYQYFDGEKSFFSRDCLNDSKEARNIENAESPKELASAAVISKNIKFSAVPKNSAPLTGKSGLDKYFSKYYRSESYFAVNNAGNEYGLYHTLPLNIKKYYSLSQDIDKVIPYDYLVILFLREKLSIRDNEKEALIFIEKTEGIYKIMAVLNGFNLFPIISFKEDMLNDNLNLLKTKLNSKEIKIDKIVSNDSSLDFSILFIGAAVINFAEKDFFDFFAAITKTTPHFENLDTKFQTIENRKKRKLNVYITAFIAAIFIMQVIISFISNKIFAEDKRIKLLDDNTAVISHQIQENKRKNLFNNHFPHVDVAGYLKSFMLILPEGVKIKNLNIIRSKKNYIIKVTAFNIGGYRKFTKNYNIIKRKVSSLASSGSLHISYNIDKFEKPFIKFYGKVLK
jgi:hypothetical protein